MRKTCSGLVLNILPEFLRVRVIDRRGGRFLVCSMRIVPLVLAALVAGGMVSAQTTNTSGTPKPPHAPTALPTPKAEPENPNAYLPPSRPELEGPSAADVGPVQRHFVRASEPDTVADTETNDNAAIAALQEHEKMDLDKRIKVPLIHDVQNDGGTLPNNQALQYEITYLNWGAVTREQLEARRGHYFTITWKNGGPPADFTARFQYREVKSQEVVRELTQEMHHVHGAVRSYFAVTSAAYQAYGPVVSWRFTVLRGDTVVAEAKSFIW